jgi:hypothetical protein
MTLPRITALATILIHLVASVAMGLVYLCQMSGQVGLAACCCPGQDQSEARTQARAQRLESGPGQHDSAYAPGCCDVSQIEASLVPSLPEKRTAEPLPVIAWAWAWNVFEPAPRLPVHRGITPARVALSPPEGPPLYLRIRSLLL